MEVSVRYLTMVDVWAFVVPVIRVGQALAATSKNDESCEYCRTLTAKCGDEHHRSTGDKVTVFEKIEPRATSCSARLTKGERHGTTTPDHPAANRERCHRTTGAPSFPGVEGLGALGYAPA